MRLLTLLLALAFAAAGIVFGALNPQSARIDFYWFSLDGSLGAMLLIALLGGALLGGVAVLLGVVWPLRRKLRRLRRDAAQPASAPAAPAESEPA